ncbi:hypothetical protein MMC25_003217 [Agyrium rufum]|nr:hypothetical protein [Agyrium rufum]
MAMQELHFVNFANPAEDSKRKETRKLVRTLAMKDALQKKNRLSKSKQSDKSSESTDYRSPSLGARSTSDDGASSSHRSDSVPPLPQSRPPPHHSPVMIRKVPKGRPQPHPVHASPRKKPAVTFPAKVVRVASPKTLELGRIAELKGNTSLMDPFWTTPVQPTREQLLLCAAFVNGMSTVSKIWYPGFQESISQELIPMMLTVPALFHAHMFAATAAWVGVADPDPQLTVGPIAHENRAIRQIGQAIRIGKEALTDELLLAVAVLAAEELFYRNYVHGIAHIKGLIKMIKIRGGIDKIQNRMTKYYIERLTEYGTFDLVKIFSAPKSPASSHSTSTDKSRKSPQPSPKRFHQRLVTTALNPDRTLPPWGRTMPPALIAQYQNLLHLANDINALPTESVPLHILFGAHLHAIDEGLDSIFSETHTTPGLRENDMIRLTLVVLLRQIQDLASSRPEEMAFLHREFKRVVGVSVDFMSLEHMRLLMWCLYVIGPTIAEGPMRGWVQSTIKLTSGYAGGSWMSTRRILRDFVWVDRFEGRMRVLWEQSRW